MPSFPIGIPHRAFPLGYSPSGNTQPSRKVVAVRPRAAAVCAQPSGRQLSKVGEPVLAT